jgi:exodeoxyribonuclease X
MLAVIDCETTGLDSEKDKVVEVAIVEVSEKMRTWSSLINPGIAIPPTARAIHHISDVDVSNAPTLTTAMLKAQLFFDTKNVCLAAHYAPFDSKFLGQPIAICTYRCAAQIWPDAPGYGNQVLRYWLPGLDDRLKAAARVRSRQLHKQLLAAPHRALTDAWVTAHILQTMLELGHDPKALTELTAAPILFKTVGFGKHFGQRWDSVPRDYLRWILDQGDFDADTQHTARHHYRTP